MLEFGVYLILIVLAGILCNTIIKGFKNFKVKINKYRNINEKEQSTSHSLNGWELELEESIYLNTFGKWYMWFFTLAMCLVTIYDDPTKINSENKFLQLIMMIAISIIFLAVIWFLHNSSFNGMEKIGMYYIKIFILLSFTLGILEMGIKTFTSVGNLFIGIAIPVIFSFFIMKSVIDSFKSYIFQVFNFIVLILFLNLFFIGYMFGMFYGVNNNEYLNTNGEFIFFQKENIDQLNSNLNWGAEEILLITYKGLKPFFSFVEFEVGEGIVDFIPFFEFIFGSIYNLTIIAFFISYSVTKLINHQELSNNCNVSNLEFTQDEIKFLKQQTQQQMETGMSGIVLGGSTATLKALQSVPSDSTSETDVQHSR